MKRTWLPVIAACLAFAAGAPAEAQQRPARSRTDAAAIVEGVVREVFRSLRVGGIDYLVQIDVRRSELGRGAVDARRLLTPAPGEQVYVHVPQPAVAGPITTPAEGSSVRAYLSPRAEGSWEGASPDWFEPSKETFERRGGNDLPPPADDRADGAPTAPRDGSILAEMGLKAERIAAGDRIVFKVIDVAPESAAQKAGFEKGDVIIGANGRGFTGLDQADALIRKEGQVARLEVRNVRTGQQATVRIDVPNRDEAGSPAGSGRSLGVRVQPRRLGLRVALEVTGLDEGGAAQRAGIEKGDVLLEAGGVKLTDEGQLRKAVDQGGASLTVTVRDSRTGKDVPVEVKLGAADPTRPGGIPAPTPAPPRRPTPDAPPAAPGALSSKSFGITTEAGTVGLLPVVKVASVARDSAAEKAGLKVGDAITEVDDRVVFAPDLFEAALGQAGSTFTLTLLNEKTGEKSSVKVDLGR